MTELKPIRVPIAAPLADREIARSSTYATDSMLINCYMETQPDGRVLVCKRPGLTGAYSYGGGGALNGQGLVYHQAGLYAMGSNTLYRLSGNANGSADGTSWGNATAPWSRRYLHASIVFNGQVFIFGGGGPGGFTYYNDVWATSDPNGVNWTQVVSAAPWEARFGAQVVVLGNTLYLMGGVGASGALNDVWSSSDGVNWTEVVGEAPWVGRNGHSVVAFNQGIFLLGGLNNSGTYLNDVWFSPDGATWTQQVANAGWSARYQFSTVVYANKIWVLGGFNGAGLLSCYSSTDGINWTNTGNLPAARSGMGATVYRDRIFLSGGDDGATRTTTVWSTTDGATFSVVTAAYGGAAVRWHTLLVHTAASSAINAPTMWWVGGDLGSGPTNINYQAILNVALPSSFSIATAGVNTTQFKFTTQNAGIYLVFKNTSDAWVLFGGLVQKITSANYPSTTVPGIANLDDTVYVMDAAGVIYGSNLSTPFDWSSLNFITADYESDVGIAISKYQNYVVALKSTTMQFYYNAGRYPGSPLLPVKNATSRVGCSSAAFIVAMDNTLIFMARTEQRGNYIAMLNGFQPVKISDASVDRILDSWVSGTADTAFPLRVNGHDFYVMTLSNGGTGITLAFDMAEKRWHVWQTGSTAGKFRASNYATDGTTDYLQDMALGLIYSVSPAVYQDNLAAITVQSTGVAVDGGTNQRKFCSSLTVIGDRRTSTAPNTASVSWSDDDGQTFNTPITVDLSVARPRISRCGSFRRRTHRITHSANNPFRVEALELGLR